MFKKNIKKKNGARSETRTHTTLRSADFESAASTDSAIRAQSISNAYKILAQNPVCVQTKIIANMDLLPFREKPPCALHDQDTTLRHQASNPKEL